MTTLLLDIFALLGLLLVAIPPVNASTSVVTAPCVNSTQTQTTCFLPPQPSGQKYLGLVNTRQPSLTSIPLNMHKCISLAITTSGFLLGLQAAQGTSTPDSVNSTLNTEIHNVEGCVLHSDRLFSNSNSNAPSQSQNPNLNSNPNVLH